MSIYYNELYHYGVKGMKWGVRKKTNNSSKTTTGGKIKKVVGKAVIRKAEKVRARNESYNRTTKYFGVGGAAIRSYTENKTRKAVKGVLVHAVNEAANAYITNNLSKYRIAKGVNFVRNATIKGLSVSAKMDDIRIYADIARSAMYKTSNS